MMVKRPLQPQFVTIQQLYVQGGDAHHYLSDPGASAASHYLSRPGLYGPQSLVSPPWPPDGARNPRRTYRRRSCRATKSPARAWKSPIIRPDEPQEMMRWTPQRPHRARSGRHQTSHPAGLLSPVRGSSSPHEMFCEDITKQSVARIRRNTEHIFSKATASTR